MMATRANITDRAKRYRAQNNVTGPRKCVLCGSRSDLQVMHLSGNESDGERSNLAYGCRSCNGKLSAAFKRIGAGRPTNQYNPAAGKVPTYEQYKWGVTHHNRGEHDEGGAVIHATPKHKRIQYAKMIAAEAAPARRAGAAQRRADFESRWNPGRDWREESFNDLAKQGFMKRPKTKSVTMYRAMTPHGATYTGPNKATAEQHVRQYGGSVETFKSNPWPFSSPGRSARDTTPATGGIAHHMAKRPAAAKSKAGPVSSHKGYQISRTESGEFFSSLDPSSWYETKAQVQRAIDGYLKGRSNPAKPYFVYLEKIGAPDQLIMTTDDKKKAAAFVKSQEGYGKFTIRRNPAAFDRCVKAVQKKGGAKNAYAVCASSRQKTKKNPAASSAEVFEEFHGYPPTEVITVSKKVHFHSHLAALGELEFLKVWGCDKQGHTIEGFSGSILCSNEGKNQMFIEGGDQSVNLKEFGIKSGHEMETLGKVVAIGYYTRKDHLEDEGGEAPYVHQFRTTNKNGRHVVVKPSRYPDLVYDARNEQLLFSGGSYEILAEGINK